MFQLLPIPAANHTVKKPTSDLRSRREESPERKRGRSLAPREAQREEGTRRAAPAGGGELLERLGAGALDVQKRALDPRPAERVLAEPAIAPHDAVAWDQERHRVLRERGASGADGLGPPDLPGDPAIGAHLAGG